MINRAVLIGRLTRDAELRYTQGGTAVAQFTLAVNRSFTNQNGEREADFINCVIWRKPAENFSKFTHKGSQVGIEGRIQTRHYENTEGRRIYLTEVIVDNFSLLEKKSDSDNSQPDSQQTPSRQQSSSKKANARDKQQAPSRTATSNPQNDPFAANGDKIDISDDDLPF
jgi:single-strand DNA-binding protein